MHTAIMKSSKPSKLYVVFVGRQPGVYGSWEECESQVLGYKGNKHQSFKTLEEAQLAWMRYCEHESVFESSTKPVSPSPEDSSKRESQFIDNNEEQQFVVNCSMQDWVRQVCHNLRISEPRITLSEIKNFKADSNDAREDVAVEVLRTLLASCGKQIKDFNHFNVKLLQDQILTYQQEIAELHAENAFLTQQVFDLRTKLGDL
ncbi:Ribosomal protein L9/RNase H1, N-terminal [Sesbania bispinosa]|nr:Ribosomal protein L9/RNase H1, N-terminal [Sesbania bispinosa]